MLRLANAYFFIPFLVAYLSMFILRKVALRTKIVDVPDERKTHKEPTPLLGGIAIFLGVIAGLCFNPYIFKEFFAVFVGAAFILIINLVDDIKGLSAKVRIVAELAVALLVIFLGIRVSFLPYGFWGDLGEIIITLIWLVGLINAFNYLDGVDGLATGIAAISAFFFAVILFATFQFNLGVLSIILIGSSLGFLPHNFKKAKVFLGDAGSKFIGFFIGCLALTGNWAQDNIVKLVIPILILGVPIFDMTFTTIMRIKERKVKTVMEWLSYSGRDHFHHYLLDLGLRLRGVLFFIYLVSICLGISAIMVSNEKAFVGFLAILQGSIIFAGIGVLMIMGKRQRAKESS